MNLLQSLDLHHSFLLCWKLEHRALWPHNYGTWRNLPTQLWCTRECSPRDHQNLQASPSKMRDTKNIVTQDSLSKKAPGTGGPSGRRELLYGMLQGWKGHRASFPLNVQHTAHPICDSTVCPINTIKMSDRISVCTVKLWKWREDPQIKECF